MLRLPTPDHVSDPSALGAVLGPVRAVERTPIVTSGFTGARFERLEVMLATGARRHAADAPCLAVFTDALREHGTRGWALALRRLPATLDDLIRSGPAGRGGGVGVVDRPARGLPRLNVGPRRR